MLSHTNEGIVTACLVCGLLGSVTALSLSINAIASSSSYGRSNTKLQASSEYGDNIEISRRNAIQSSLLALSSSCMSFFPDTAFAVDDALAASICEDPEAKTIAIFEKAAPSVVYIDTFVEQRDAFSPNVQEVPLGAGSGFVWDDAGHIVTNYHVVRQSRLAQVAILSRVFDDDPDERKGIIRDK